MDVNNIDVNATDNGMLYLARLREAQNPGARLRIVTEIENDPTIGENELTSLVAILGDGRFEARGRRDDLIVKLRQAVR